MYVVQAPKHFKECGRLSYIYIYITYNWSWGVLKILKALNPGSSRPAPVIPEKTALVSTDQARGLGINGAHRSGSPIHGNIHGNMRSTHLAGGYPDI